MFYHLLNDVFEIDHSLALEYAAVIIMVLLIYITFRKSNYRKQKHQVNIQTAARVIEKLRSFKEPYKKAKQLTYLKKISPYVFEELLLTLFSEMGYKIIRNKSYSNDGGLDGKIILPSGELVLIQAKRYSGAISRKHLLGFQALVLKSQATTGYFIHTGRTSAPNLDLYRNSSIVIYSGDKLLELLNMKEARDRLKGVLVGKGKSWMC